MARATRKKRNKKSVSQFQKIVRSYQSRPDKIFHTVLNNLEPHEVSKSSKQISENFIFKELFLPAKNNFNLYYGKLVPISGPSIIPWVEAILQKSKNKVNSFVLIEKKVTALILQGEYEKADRLCNEIYDDFGISFWWLQLKTFLVEQTEGIEAAEKFVSHWQTDSNRKLTNLIINGYKYRIDTESIYFSFSDDLHRKLKEVFCDDEYTYTLLSYRLLPLHYKLDIDPFVILKTEMAASIIDLYKAYLFSLSIAVRDNKYKEVWKESSFRVQRIIDDKVLKNLSFSLGGNINLNELIVKDYIEYVDLYTKGDYKLVSERYESLNRIQKEPSFSSFEMYVKSYCKEGKVDPDKSKPYFSDLYSLIMKDDLFEDGGFSCLSKSFSLDCINWFFDFSLFVMAEMLNIKMGELKSIRDMYLSRSLVFNSFKVDLLKEDFKKKSIISLDEVLGDGLTHSLYKAYSCDCDIFDRLDIEEDRKSRFLARYYININDYDSALVILRELVESKDVITRNESVTLYIDTLIKSGNKYQAAKYICQLYVQDKKRYYVLPLDTLCESFDRKDINKSEDIYSLICFYIYSSIFDDSYLQALKIMFERFMLSNDYNNFLCLLDDTKWPEEITSYFLEYVFIPDVIQGPLLYDSSEKATEERIRICQYLIDSGIGDKEKLSVEAKNRSKELVLTAAKIHVDNTKIDVDVDYVKAKVEKDCRQLYSNYIKACEETPNLSESHNEITRFLDKLNFKSDPVLSKLNIYSLLQSLHVQNTPLDEKNKLFAALLQKIRDEYVSGVKGFSGYLSTRIRHGTLDTHLRKAFTESGVIDVDSSDSKFGYMWSSNIQNATYAQMVQIDTLLKGFNDKVDEIINKVLDKWLQIMQFDMDMSEFNTLKDNEALFSYSVTNSLSVSLHNELGVSAPYEDVIKLALKWLSIVTEENLKGVALKFESDLIPDFKAAFEGLVDDLEIISDNSQLDLTNLFSAIASSKQKLINLVRESKVWFSLSNSSFKQDVDFEIINEIAEKSLFINVNSVIQKDIVIPGDKVICYVDILYTLYSNAVKHSGLDKQNLHIDIDVSKDEGRLILKVNNTTMARDDWENETTRLIAYQNIYETEDTIVKLRNEGNTGFYKVQKTIKEDLGMLYSCNIYYLCEDQFSVIIEIY